MGDQGDSEAAAVAPGRYLLLGAAGLVGRHALARLAGSPGVTVRAAVHRRPLDRVDPNVEVLQLDLSDRDACLAAMEGVDHVLHFAGRVASAAVLERDPVGPIQENLVITSNVFEAAFRARVERVVFLSSTCGYPDSEDPLDEDRMFEGEPPGGWFYLGWTSRYLEIQARALAERSGQATSFVALRPSLIYGEFDNFSEDEGHFVPSLVRRVVERRTPLEVWGKGDQRRDLIHASDVVDAALRALHGPEGFSAFNVASGDSPTVLSVLERLVALDDFEDATIEHLPQTRPTAAGRSFTTNRAADEIGFQARVRLDDGLRRTLEWYRSAGEQARR